MKYIFKSQFSIEECKLRLCEEMRDKSDNCDLIKFFSRFNKPTICKANNHNNRFWVKSYRGGRDAWVRVFHGEFLNKGNYTLIEGQFRVNILVVLFTSLWELGVIGVLIIGIIAGALEFIIVPIIMTVFMLLLVYAGVENSKQKTLDFIIKTFEAEYERVCRFAKNSNF